MFSEKIDHATVVDFQRFSVKIGKTEHDAQIGTVSRPQIVSKCQA